MNSHGHRQRGPCSPWIFIHITDKVEEGLMVLFFSLVFSVALSWKFFCRHPCEQQSLLGMQGKNLHNLENALSHKVPLLVRSCYKLLIITKRENNCNNYVRAFGIIKKSLFFNSCFNLFHAPFLKKDSYTSTNK